MNKIAIALRSIIFFVWAFFACWTAGTSVVTILANARLGNDVAASPVLALIVPIVTLFMIIASHTELRYPCVRTGKVPAELTWVAVSAILSLVAAGLAHGVDRGRCNDDSNFEYCANTALLRKLVVALAAIAWAYLIIFGTAVIWRWRVDGRYILWKSVFEINWLRRRDPLEKGHKERPNDVEVRGVFDDMTQTSTSMSSPHCISPPVRGTSRQPEPQTPTPLWAKQTSIRRAIDPPFKPAPSEPRIRPSQRAHHRRPHRHREHRPPRARASLSPPQPTLSAQPSAVSATVANDMTYIARTVSPIISDFGSTRYPDQELQSLPSLAEMVSNRVIRPPPRQHSLGSQASTHRRHGGGDPIDRPFSPARSATHRPNSESEDLTRFYYL
ncbi:hypothetical protein HDZ31DRAFT_36048 [Schizophyllum fasciatum]